LASIEETKPNATKSGKTKTAQIQIHEILNKKKTQKTKRVSKPMFLVGDEMNLFDRSSFSFRIQICR